MGGPGSSPSGADTPTCLLLGPFSTCLLKTTNRHKARINLAEVGRIDMVQTLLWDVLRAFKCKSIIVLPLYSSSSSCCSGGSIVTTGSSLLVLLVACGVNLSLIHI
eukprot:TRINITY_DN61466_c0_g1_i1.p1 TRINITY_DN61466_c0_g1~~TRINITY_DN61466_c0_g1_i1.p1  ORF type:complete len:106 (-),score=16.83 TRINITY_DN61466_c0_g1_i1:121-438(-)